MSAAVAIDERPLFRSARAALTFALTRDGAPARPVIAKMADKTYVGRGLSGMDGAAQAGMILGALRPLGRLLMAVLRVSCTPRWGSCPTCHGKMATPAWREALADLADESVRVRVQRGPDGDLLRDENGDARRFTVLPPGTAPAYRVALLLKVFAHQPVTLHEIAQEYGRDDDTVSRHYRALMRWLRGARGTAKDDGPEGLEQVAWREAESALRDAGIVG